MLSHVNARAGTALTAATGFTVLSLTGIIQAPASGFPRVVSIGIDILTSIKRIHDFLTREEIVTVPFNSPSGHARRSESRTGEPAIVMESVTAKWGDKPSNADIRSRVGCLKRILSRLLSCCGVCTRAGRRRRAYKELATPLNDAASSATRDNPPSVPNIIDASLRVRPGSLVFVIGEIGCGKSTLLSAILNEVPIESGRVAVNGRVSYVSQTAWLQNVRPRPCF